MKRTGDGPNLRTKALKTSAKPGNEWKSKERDGLVKHTSNLPGYLRKVEKGENLQGRPLNFRVLD